jgi:hypothetical protein
LFSSDPVKHSSILKKQCELYTSLGQLENSIDRANLLLKKNDKEITKFVAKVLAPVLSHLSHPTLQIVRNIFIQSHYFLYISTISKYFITVGKFSQ